MRIWKSAGLAVLLVGGVAGFVWVGTRDDGPVKVFSDSISEQRPADVPAARSFACRVAARETVAAGGVVGAVVDRVLVEVGAVVVDGQVLAVVRMPAAALSIPRAWPGATGLDGGVLGARREASELQASVLRLRIKANAARVTFEKQELLHRAGVTPRLVYESALVERDRAVEELALAEEASRLADNALTKLEDLRMARERDFIEQQRAAALAARDSAVAEVHAPSAGLVLERNISAGDTVTDANRAALFRIAPHPELLRAEFGALPAGKQVSLLVAGVLVSATVAEGGTFADFESRTAVVLPGSPCTVTIK